MIIVLTVLKLNQAGDLGLLTGDAYVEFLYHHPSRGGLVPKVVERSRGFRLGEWGESNSGSEILGLDIAVGLRKLRVHGILCGVVPSNFSRTNKASLPSLTPESCIQGKHLPIGDFRALPHKSSYTSDH